MPEKRGSFRAPGRADRSGISLPEFFRRFPDDESAEWWVERVSAPGRGGWGGWGGG